MEKYATMEEIGRGSYGVVCKAFNKQTGEIVAIKKLFKKYESLDVCMNLREVKSLMKLNNHPNVVKLKEIVVENDTLFLVFVYMECSLQNCMEGRENAFSENEIRDLCFQVFQGLSYMHCNGYFHRDLKPDNILVKNGLVKICDFGQARETDDQPPYSEYVNARWYRAPEVLLYSVDYNSKVDMWAMGAIMAELFTLQRLFEGRSTLDVLSKICKVLGTPTESTWIDGLSLAYVVKYRFPEFLGFQFSAVLPYASPDAVNLISSLLSWDPKMRPTAMEALQHPFFDRCYLVPRVLRHEPPSVISSLIRGPILFEMALQRELLKQERLKGCGNDSERVEDPGEDLILNGFGNDLKRVDDSKEDLIRKGCTDGLDGVEDSVAIYDSEIKEEFKSGLTEKFLWSGLIDARVTLFCKKYLLLVINSILCNKHQVLDVSSCFHFMTRGTLTLPRNSVWKRLCEPCVAFCDRFNQLLR